MLRRLSRSVLASALVGVAALAIEIWNLRRGGIPVAGYQVFEAALVFAVLGVVFALPGLVLAALLDRDTRSATARRALAALPAFSAALAFAAIAVNVLWLPRFFAPASLAADAALLLAAALALGLFALRPWSRRGDAALAVGVAGAAVAGWIITVPTRGAAGGARVVQSAATERPPDVFLILIDTMRADHLGAYGYERPTSPHIDALAADGVVMERAFSSTNWTRPAVASLFTSTMPSRHTVTNLDRAVPESFPLLAEHMQARGHTTGFITVGINVEPSDGYDRGADYFSSIRSRHVANRTLVMRRFVLHFFPWTEALLPWTEDRDAAADPNLVTNRALEWVRSVDPAQPVFAYLHYLGPHSPYRPPPEFDRFSTAPRDTKLEEPPSQWAGAAALTPDETRRMIDLYDGEVLRNDASIGALLDGLRAAGRLDHAVVAIVADHGEAFGGNDGEDVWGHNASGFSSVVHIPMIFWASPALGIGEPARLKVPASLVDVGPTLLDLVGQPAPEGFDGSSLVPWLRGGAIADREVFVENPNNDEIGVRTLDWDYFEGKTGDGFGRWLFAAGDAAQRENLVEREPALAERLRQSAERRRDLDRSRAGRASEIELDETRRRQLEELGYITE